MIVFVGKLVRSKIAAGAAPLAPVNDWLAVSLVAVLIALSPLADASPPDPSWIPGIYDGGDFDEVVVMITQASARVDTSAAHDSGPQPVAAETLAPVGEPALAGTPPSSHLIRGPPGTGRTVDGLTTNCATATTVSRSAPQMEECT